MENDNALLRKEEVVGARLEGKNRWVRQKGRKGEDGMKD